MNVITWRDSGNAYLTFEAIFLSLQFDFLNERDETTVEIETEHGVVLCPEKLCAWKLPAWD